MAENALQNSASEKVVNLTHFDSRPKVVTLCGSTKFWSRFEELNRQLTLAGNVVFSVAIPASKGSENELPPQQKAVLDNVHFHKIRMSDEIFVINVDGYIGESTKREIEFAKKIGRKINYLEPIVAGPLFEK